MGQFQMVYASVMLATRGIVSILITYFWGLRLLMLGICGLRVALPLGAGQPIQGALNSQSKTRSRLFCFAWKCHRSRWRGYLVFHNRQSVTSFSVVTG